MKFIMSKSIFIVFFPFLISASLLFSCSEKPLASADNDFDVTVPNPTYSVNKPKILFDEGHDNIHKTNGTYKPFAELIKNDGCDLMPTDKPITSEVLSGFDIYIIANARGKGDLNDTPAFTEEECTTIKKWVNNGGSLLLITDHFPMGSAVELLANKFGVEMQKGMVQDSVYHDKSSTDESQLQFSRENKLLADCEITKGIDKVITFTGQSIKCKDSCVSFLNLSDAAYDLTAKTEVIKDGNDTRVNVTFDRPQSAKGMSQGLALKYGQGKVIVLGEAAMLTAQLTRDDSKFGMSVNPDNKKLALNIIHWLANK
jgi:hypothetical protein